MDLKNFYIFKYLLKTKSYSQTALKFNLSQPAVTKIIQNFEKNLEDSIFYKHSINGKRKLSLTQVGQEFSNYVDDILKCHEVFENKIKQMKNSCYGELRIGLPTLGSTLVSKYLAKFNEKYPEIHLNILETGSLALQEALKENEIEIGIILNPAQEYFNSFLLYDVPLHLVVSKKSPFSSYTEISIEQLKNEKFILFNDTFALNPLILKECHKSNFKPNIVCKSSQWDFITKMVELNIGIALLPKPYTITSNPNLVSIPLKNADLRWKLYIAWEKNNNLSSIAKNWLNMVSDDLI